LLQRYKLRLADGTVLTVDQDGLRTWLTDERATVQVAGTQEWRPLRQFLADEDSAARLARALVPPTPRPAKPAKAVPTLEVPPLDPAPPLSIGSPPMVQALADEPVVVATPAPPWREARDVAGESPVIRLKPLDEGPPTTDTEEWVDDDPGDPGKDAGARHDRLDGPLLQVLTTFGALLSRCLGPLAPLVSRWPPAKAPGARAGSSGQRLSQRQPAVERTPLATRRPLQPPTPVSELPVLRLADVPEAPEAGDVYEGEPGDSIFPTLWHWTVRIVLLGGLVAGGALAALNWRSWFPRAAEVGQSMFAEVDRQAHARQAARDRERALSEAAERLPHLAPATIQLVLSTNDNRVLEPPEVFQLAEEAADRGQGALAPPEAAELRTLQQQLLAQLRPPERARVADYDRARANRVVFPFENPYALELLAKGARALPARSRERLQQLLGKAVAAGLGAPAALASPAAGTR
jgi:hypothetical protein